MAQYSELPVYKSSYDLLLIIFQFVKNFTKEYKYTLGEKLKNETLELLINIFRSNSANEKKNTIQNARESIEVIRLLVRLSKDLKLVDLKKFVIINEKVEEVSKQLTGWQKSQK